MSYVEVPGAKVPIRMWTDPASVEDVAMQQLRNVATLPWIKGLAVMPDVHLRQGCDGRLGHRHAGRGLSGGGGRGHRVRHVGGQDVPDGE